MGNVRARLVRGACGVAAGAALAAAALTWAVRYIAAESQADCAALTDEAIELLLVGDPK